MNGFLRDWADFSLSSVWMTTHDLVYPHVKDSDNFRFLTLSAPYAAGLAVSASSMALTSHFFSDKIQLQPTPLRALANGTSALATWAVQHRTDNIWAGLAAGVATAGLLSAAVQLLPHEQSNTQDTPQTENLSHLGYQQRIVAQPEVMHGK
ncbi:MAG: hypothetical protein EAY65_05120 [Alphaproteobacteria bacterium]|nr:MAG: hypothetical protein EAY65_05120 [Alphaproteobacteria bacterium]